MIFAAGKGTRLKPLTDFIPKALVPVAGKPLIWRVLDKLALAGATRIAVNVHHHAQQIVNFLSLAQAAYPNVDICISDESEQLLETGGGIKKAQGIFNTDEPILIHNVDIIHNADLADFYHHAKGTDALLMVSQRQTKRYLIFDDDMRLVGWTNTETGEVRSPYPNIDQLAKRRLAFSGIHAFSPTLFGLMDKWPERFPIMDFYLDACCKADIRGYEVEGLQLTDVGKLDTLETADGLTYL